MRSLRALFVLLLACVAATAAPAAVAREVTWTMVDVSAPEWITGDAHVLRFPDGKIYLIDTGYEELARKRLLPFLRHAGITRLDRVIITHAHKNHYGGLVLLAKSGISMGEVLFNLPDRARCDAERPWGCDYAHVEQTRARLAEMGVPLGELHGGDVLYKSADGGIRLEVLYQFDGARMPVHRTDINDTSAVMRLDADGVSVMFAGDLNEPLGKWLAKHGENLHADILKVPHHGLDSAAPNAFFDRVGARVALVPGPAPAWASDRASRLRDYFTAHHVQVYDNGLHGNVEVRIANGKFSVHTQRTPAVN